MPKEYKDLVVGLDIGTAKVMAVVAEVMPSGELRVAGLGVAPSHGLKRGVVVDIEMLRNVDVAAPQLPHISERVSSRIVDNRRRRAAHGHPDP